MVAWVVFTKQWFMAVNPRVKIFFSGKAFLGPLLQQRGVRTNNRCPCLLKVIAIKTKPGLNPQIRWKLSLSSSYFADDLWKQGNPVTSPLSGNWWGHCPALKHAESSEDGSHHCHTTYMLWLRSVPRAMMVFDGKDSLLRGEWGRWWRWVIKSEWKWAM